MNFMKLLSEAQFHGAKRIADRKYNRFAWAWWTGTFLLLLWGAVTILTITISRYFQNPTFLEQTNSTRPVMAFPAVLVCPEIEFSDHKMNAFMEDIELPSALNASIVRSVLPHLAAFFALDVKAKKKNLMILQNVLDHNYLDVETAGRRLTTSCEETFIRCRLFGVAVNCSTLFEMELTAYGFCCVFNGRSLNREIENYGIPRTKPEVKLYTSNVGPYGSLMFVVNNSQPLSDVDLTYKWLVLQDAQSYVHSIVNGTPLTRGTEQWAAMQYLGFRISDDAMSLSNELRGCRMSYESLKYFPVYRRTYCLLECEMERTLKLCNCLRVIHPRIPGARLCRVRSLACARKAAVPFGSNHCICPFTCDLDMDSTVMQSFELKNGSFPTDRFYEGLDFKKVTVVRVFINNHQSRIYSRRLVFDTIHLFSQLGGIFNVFFGCSVLTMIELAQLLYHGLWSWWSSKQTNNDDFITRREKKKRQKKIRFKTQ